MSKSPFVIHGKFGKGKILDQEGDMYRIDFGKFGIYEISAHSPELEFLEALNDKSMNEENLKSALKSVLMELDVYPGYVKLGSKWKQGKLILQPGQEGAKEKEIPLETFFHKIVMVRDRLRVLEQQINSHKVLSDSEKVNLQQYITRIYGSLTSFNLLFAEKEDYFVGDKSSEE
jgi:hypothetical protein